MKYIKIILIYIALILLNFFGSIIYLSFSELPGGEVGMLPFLVIIVISISSVISLGLTSILNFKFKTGLIKSIFIHQIVYIITFFIGGLDPLSKIYDLWIVIISFICCGLIILALFIFNMIKRNEK